MSETPKTGFLASRPKFNYTFMRSIVANSFAVLVTSAKGERWFIKILRKAGEMFQKQKPNKQTNDDLMNPITQLKVTPRPKDKSLPFTPKPRDPTELRRRAHGNYKQKPPADVLTFPPPVSIMLLSEGLSLFRL